MHSRIEMYVERADSEWWQSLDQRFIYTVDKEEEILEA